MRLSDYGYDIGLISDERYARFNKKKENIYELGEKLKSNKITPTVETNEYLQSIGTTILKDGITLYDLLKRPEITFEHIEHFMSLEYSNEVKEQVSINTKYEGYIKKANKEAEKMIDLDNKKIPDDIDYDKIHNLASEAKQKLNQIRPTSIGQAIRISGVNPADISLIMVYLKKEYFYDSK